MFGKKALMDNLSRDLDRARGKRNDALASDVTTLSAHIAELEARLSEEKDRRERERIGGEIEGIKKRLKDTATAFAPVIAGLCDATEAAAAVAPEARELNSFLLSVATEVDIVIEYLLLRCARATLCWTCRSRSSRRPSCRKRMIAYSFFQHGYVATKRREKKNQRRIGSARQLDLTVKRRDRMRQSALCEMIFGARAATVTCARAFAGLACLMP
jgi:hypothetical protein